MQIYFILCKIIILYVKLIFVVWWHIHVYKKYEIFCIKQIGIEYMIKSLCHRFYNPNINISWYYVLYETFTRFNINSCLCIKKT